MRNKKGFTLVELVIVIAVIAILAGVMIGTFASVVKKAKESAKMQEMAAAKQEQTATDVLEKLKNQNWLGWEDFEEKLAAAVGKSVSNASKVDEEGMKTVVTNAVEAAFAKYASSIGTGNTGLTEEQVKYIVETALAKSSYSGVTAEQVKAIVNNATSGLSNLNKSQVQAIVDAAQAKNLTLTQVSAVVNAAKEDLEKNQLTEATVNAAVTKALKDYKASTLTEKEISDLLAKYITNGTAKGNFEWYNANYTSYEIEKADELVALATITKGGETFKGKTITLTKDVELKEKWTPIGQGSYSSDGFCGTINGNGKTISNVSFDVNFEAATRNGYNALFAWSSNGAASYLTDKVAFGFVAYLGEGGSISGLNLVYNMTFKASSVYTYFGGVVGLLDGGKVTECTVSGTITGDNRLGGIAGIMASGEISKCNVSGLKLTSTQQKENDGHDTVGGLVAYVDSGFSSAKATDTVVCKLSSNTVAGVEVKSNRAYSGKIIGTISNNNTQGYKGGSATTTVVSDVEFNLGTAGNHSGDKKGTYDVGTAYSAYEAKYDNVAKTYTYTMSGKLPA